MRSNRREFFQTAVALGAMPALAEGRAGRLARKGEAYATPAVGAVQQGNQGPDTTWRKAVRVYYAQESAHPAKSLAKTLADATEAANLRTTANSAWSTSSEVVDLEGRIAEKEAELESLKKRKAASPAEMQSQGQLVNALLVDLARLRASLGPKQQQARAKQTALDSLYKRILGSGEKGFALIGGSTGSNTPVVSGERIDLAQVALFTSNGEETDNNKPWNKKPKDFAFLSVIADYVSPAIPAKCIEEQNGTARVLNEFHTGNNVMALDFQPARLFHGLPLKVTGEIDVVLNLMDVFDENDRSFWDKLGQWVLTSLKLLTGFSFLNAATLGALKLVSEVVNKLLDLAASNQNNREIWNTAPKITFGKKASAGVALLRPGYYVLADADLDITGWMLHGNRVKSTAGADLQRNYVVLNITETV